MINKFKKLVGNGDIGLFIYRFIFLLIFFLIYIEVKGVNKGSRIWGDVKVYGSIDATIQTPSGSYRPIKVDIKSIP